MDCKTIKEYLPDYVEDRLASMRPWALVALQVSQLVGLFGIFSLSIMHVAAGTYNPFIYFML